MLKRLLDWMPKRCPNCRRVRCNVKSRRQRTAYVDDAQNFCTLCPDCQDMADEYWADRWAEYYSGCL